MNFEQAVIGLFRRLRLLILRREVQVVGQCRGCGSCCRDILLMDEGRWLRTEKQYRRLIESDPDHACFEHIGDDGFGHMTFTCRFLGPDNNCTSYETRLSLCRKYPTKSLYYRGGCLRQDCGFSFKAVTFRDVLMRRKRARIPSFSTMLERELEQERDRQ